MFKKALIIIASFFLATPLTNLAQTTTKTDVTINQQQTLTEHDYLNNINNNQTLVTVPIALGAPYSSINKLLYNTATIFQQHPLFGNYTVNYFSDSTGMNNINNQPQVVGTVYVVITADPLDPYWKGHTNPLAVALKISLNTVLNLNGMSSITANTSATYSSINKNLFNAATAFTNHPLTGNFTVNWYSDILGLFNINNLNQAPTTVYVIISAASTDSYWTGNTNTFAITLTGNKVNVNTITSLAGMNQIVVNPSATYSSINKNLFNTATQIAVHPLTGNFAINYFSDITGLFNINNNTQKAGTVYIKITADMADPYWTGTTTLTLSLTISAGKINLSTVTSLIGLTLVVHNAANPYSAIDKTVYNGALAFLLTPLSGNFVVHYFSDATGTTNIDNSNQATGTVYVTITADPTDTYWTGTTNPLSFTLL